MYELREHLHPDDPHDTDVIPIGGHPSLDDAVRALDSLLDAIDLQLRRNGEGATGYVVDHDIVHVNPITGGEELMLLSRHRPATTNRPWPPHPTNPHDTTSDPWRQT